MSNLQPDAADQFADTQAVSMQEAWLMPQLICDT